jgi:molybdopterin molybdotransferase
MKVMEAVSPGKNVGQAGEDVLAGTALFSAGRILRPQDMGLLSAIGLAEVAVVRRPRVRIVITGNELLTAGSIPEGVRIVDANGPMLKALVERDGGMPLLATPLSDGRREGASLTQSPPFSSSLNYLVPDDPAAILAALQADADIVLISGGSSVGQEDHAPLLLAEHGELAIHGIAMRPSSPTGMGKLGEKLVFLLPGNPVSCLCAYDFFAGRAIRLLAGRAAQWLYGRQRLSLLRKLVSQVGRVDYARVRIIEGKAEPLAISGASILSSTTIADGFVIVPADSEGFPAGADVDVWLYDR